MHAYTYMSAGYSYSCKEFLQYINYFVINQKLHCMQWLAYEVSGTHFGECYVIQSCEMWRSSRLLVGQTIVKDDNADFNLRLKEILCI